MQNYTDSVIFDYDHYQELIKSLFIVRYPVLHSTPDLHCYFMRADDVNFLLAQIFSKLQRSHIQATAIRDNLLKCIRYALTRS